MTTKEKSRKGITTKETQRRVPVLGIVLGVVGVAVILAIFLSGDSTVPEGVEQFGDPVVTGEPLPPFAQGQEDAAFGMTPPAVTGTNFAGDPVSIEPGGTPTAVLFLAHWCPHCQNEVPAVQEWLDSGGDTNGVEIISVASSSNELRTNWPPSVWLDREGWEPPVIADSENSTVASAYGLTGYPYWVFMDRDGTVVLRSSGESEISVLEQIFATLGS